MKLSDQELSGLFIPRPQNWSHITQDTREPRVELERTPGPGNSAQWETFGDQVDIASIVRFLGLNESLICPGVPKDKASHRGTLKQGPDNAFGFAS